METQDLTIMTWNRPFHLILALLFLFLNNQSSIAQELLQQQLDSIEYEELLTLFNEYDRDSVNQEKIARTYLNRARKEGDTIKMARGYDRLARIFSTHKNIAFADSVIALTAKKNHKTYPALGYMIKGYEYKKIEMIVQAFSNFKVSYDFALKSDNIQQQLYILDNLISIKSIWGNRQEALELQRHRDKLVRSDNYISVLKSSTRNDADIDIEQLYISESLASKASFVFCFLNLKQFDSAYYYSRSGHEELIKYTWVEKEKYNVFFLEAEMEIKFHQERLFESLSIAENLIEKSNPLLTRNQYFNIYYYMGLSHLGLQNLDLGYKFLLKSDSIYNDSKININPSQRNLFKTLLDKSINENSKENQIIYLNKLIKADSLFKINYRFFEPDMIRYFETPILIKDKETLIEELKQKNLKSSRTIWWAILLLSITLILLVYYINRQLLYKKRFQQILEQSKYESQKNETDRNSHEISKELVNEVLERLSNFESDLVFLSSQISLISLSKEFGTNPNYLSRIINLKIGKNFSQYINDLRIDYATKSIRSNSKLRKYTIKAIAQECGYRNAESFSKAFYKRHKIYPSYFIKKLESKTRI